MKPTTLLFALLVSPSLLLAANQSFSIDGTDQSITTQSNNQEILVYQLQKPDNKKYPLDSACYFHPLRSPSGKILTDFANADHPHHRGIFMGWVEMHGKKDADFWGWGQPAPIANRKIVNATLDQSSTTGSGGIFQVTNEWLAEDQPLLLEKLQAQLTATDKANILDLGKTFVAKFDMSQLRAILKMMREIHRRTLVSVAPNQERRRLDIG